MEFAKLLIVGCGDIGVRVARLALQKGSEVTAFARNGERAGVLRESGVNILTGSLDDSTTLPQLPVSGAAVLYSVPPPGGGIIDSRVTSFIKTVTKDSMPLKLVYLSATSVYGDCGDELVDENRTPQPANHVGRRRLDAEQQFLAWGAAHDVPVVILRVSGIYGPGRIPMQRIVNREPLLNEAAAGYTNRIHADDLAQVCMAALERGDAGEIFNVSDGTISKMTDYFNAITDLMGVERLPQVPLAEARQLMTPLMFGYMSESRRISNRKMLEKLGVQLQYPTLAAGLKNSL